MESDRLYKIIFVNFGENYELYARSCSQGALFAFVEIGDIVFNQSNSPVIDPNVEKLKAEFAGVKRTYIPLHSVIRIDEVSAIGEAKITDNPHGRNNVTPFPIPTPPSSD